MYIKNNNNKNRQGWRCIGRDESQEAACVEVRMKPLYLKVCS